MATLHVPLSPVVHSAPPVAPLLHAPATVALATGAWPWSCTVIVTVAFSVYFTTLVAFGVSGNVARLSVAAYRLAQFFFPILLGGLMYLSLRVGPWSIERRERLIRLRDLAEEETRRGESKIDFQLRFPTRDEQTGELNGMLRVRGLTQDDAHIFCTPDQAKRQEKTIKKRAQVPMRMR